jgi:putative ATPase
MKEWGYGKDYRHAHDYEDAVPGMRCLPEEIGERRYYRPTERGAEKRIGERLEEIEAIRRKLRDDSEGDG